MNNDDTWNEDTEEMSTSSFGYEELISPDRGLRKHCYPCNGFESGCDGHKKLNALKNKCPKKALIRLYLGDFRKCLEKGVPLPESREKLGDLGEILEKELTTTLPKLKKLWKQFMVDVHRDMYSDFRIKEYVDMLTQDKYALDLINILRNDVDKKEALKGKEKDNSTIKEFFFKTLEKNRMKRWGEEQ